jgi:hypothetical protein
MPHRKEVRWFTRGLLQRQILLWHVKSICDFFIGEFSFDAIPHEGDVSDTQSQQHHPREKLIGATTSIYSFTNSFTLLSKKLTENKESNNKLVTIDGGPHTFWW